MMPFKKGTVSRGERLSEKAYRAAQPFSYAGMIQIRFEGVVSVPNARDTPNRFRL